MPCAKCTGASMCVPPCSDVKKLFDGVVVARGRHAVGDFFEAKRLGRRPEDRLARRRHARDRRSRQRETRATGGGDGARWRRRRCAPEQPDAASATAARKKESHVITPILHQVRPPSGKYQESAPHLTVAKREREVLAGVVAAADRDHDVLLPPTLRSSAIRSAAPASRPRRPPARSSCRRRAASRRAAVRAASSPAGRP